jgi:hypothetical protein
VSVCVRETETETETETESAPSPSMHDLGTLLTSAFVLEEWLLINGGEMETKLS